MKPGTSGYACVFLIIFYSVGILGFSIPDTRELFRNLIPMNLLVSAALLFLFHRTWNLKSVMAFLTITVTGFITELIGVNTGLLFGSYSYGSNLGIKILNTPLLIGLNWLVLIYCIYLAFGEINKKWYFPFLGSAAMVIYDFVMEPLAIQLGMWNWHDNVIPFKNYATWFIIALLLFYFLYFVKESFRNPVAKCLLLIQFLFFLILSLIF